MSWAWLLLWAGTSCAGVRGVDASISDRPVAEVPAPPVSALSAAPAEAAAPLSLASEPSADVKAGAGTTGVPALAAARRIAAQLSATAADMEALEPRALADILEIELPFLVEAEKSLKLDGDGAIELDRHGFPDRESYFAASKAAALLGDPTATAAIRGAERQALERMSAIYERTRALLFSGPNELALTTLYEEPTPGGKRMSIFDIVASERFKTPQFWVWSSQHSREAPEGYASVTADRARSPFLKDLGPGAFTTIYWAAVPGDDFGRPDAEGMRVRVNSDAFGNELTLEVLAPVGVEDDGQTRWKGFFFKKMGEEWVPGSPKKLAPSERCIFCHYRLDAEGKRHLTPLPVQLKAKADFFAVGYKDTALLATYLRMVGALSR